MQKNEIQIRNPAGKRVCTADKNSKRVFIQNAGYMTEVYFDENDDLKVVHSKVDRPA